MNNSMYTTTPPLEEVVSVEDRILNILDPETPENEISDFQIQMDYRDFQVYEMTDEEMFHWIETMEESL